MFRLIRKYLLSLSIILSAILISVSILYSFSLDVLQKIFSIFGSLSLGIALATYIYRKTQDKNAAAVDQISFFRKEVIPEWNTVAKSIKQKNPNYIPSRIRIDKPDIESIKAAYPINFDRQIAVFFDASKIGEKLSNEILDEQIGLLNMLEEFSLKVLHSGTELHEALLSIHYAFVEVIEKNAAALFFVRDILTTNKMYSAVLSLYNFWKQDVDKPHPVKNLEKHGFITKKQKDEIYEKIRTLK